MTEPDWVWPEGALLMHQMTTTSRPSLVRVTHGSMANRYGVHYISYPELGYPNGGASFYSTASQFRAPNSFDERLDVMLYETAARVRELRAELEVAERQMAAIRGTADLSGRSLRDAP